MPCNCSKDLPSPARIAANASQAAGRMIAAAVRGKSVKAKPTTVEARKVYCLACPNCIPWEKDNSFHRCTECGCWLDGKYSSKWSIATERCPMGLWEAESV